MDPLTHSLTGVMLSRVGLNRLTPRATWICVLAANAPDADAIAWFAGSMNYLNWHRHITHAVAMAPAMAILPVLLLRPFLGKAMVWRRAYFASLIAAATHPALDLMNAYGIRLGLPFTDRWYRLDWTHVIDFWITAALVLAAFGPFLSRLVSEEIGARRAPGRGWALFGLAFLLIYNGGRSLLHARAAAILEARVYNGAAPRRVAALPDPFVPFRWRGLVETADFYAMPVVNLLGEFDPRNARVFFKPAVSAAMERARGSAAIRDFLRFAQFPLWFEIPLASPEGAVRVSVTDLRFGAPPEYRFIASADIDREGRIMESRFGFGAR